MEKASSLDLYIMYISYYGDKILDPKQLNYRIDCVWS
jgi:hypothetical protein